MLTWQGKRSFGAYMETCNNMLRNLLKPLDLKMQTLRGLEPDNPLAQRDTKLVKLHWDFTLQLVSMRVWSQVYHTLLPPYCFALGFVDDDDLPTVVHHLKKIFKTIQKMEDHLKDKPSDSWVRSLLSDVGTHHWVLSREFFMVLQSVDWNFRHPSFLQMAVATFAAGSTTKYTLESAFNHLKDSLRQASISLFHVPPLHFKVSATLTAK